MQKSRRYSGACGSEHRAQGTVHWAQGSEHRAKGSEPGTVNAVLRLLNLTGRNGEAETRSKSQTSFSFLTTVTLSLPDCIMQTGRVEVLYPYFSSGFQDVTRREGEIETRGNSRVSDSSLNVVKLRGVEVCYSEEKGSGNDPTSTGQIAETGRNTNHYQVSLPDRRSISTLNFEFVTLSLSIFRMHGKTNSNERIPTKGVFTN